MAEKNFLLSYPAHVEMLRRTLSEESAMEAAVGGEFVAMGKLEYYLLKSLGLSAGQYVVDIGCGSGRLAYQLAPYPEIGYMGTDVVPDLLAHAERVCQRADWLFARAHGTSIICEEGSADFVCFFSVFTHLSHEDSFRYLREARRVLKDGGKIVFSFLEFRIHSHWEVFANSLLQRSDAVLNQFVDRHAIAVWAERLELDLELIADGDKPHFPIDEMIKFGDGRTLAGYGCLGQSVAVLSKQK